MRSAEPWSPLSCCMQVGGGFAIPGLEHSKHKLLVAAFHCAVTSRQDWLPCEAMAITFSDPEVSAVVIWTRVPEPNVGHVTIVVVLSTKVIGTADKRQNWSQRSMPYTFTRQSIWRFLCANVCLLREGCLCEWNMLVSYCAINNAYGMCVCMLYKQLIYLESSEYSLWLSLFLWQVAHKH